MKIRKAIRTFLSSIMQEGKETLEAGKIIRKYSTGQELTDEEISKVKEQMVDTLKLAGIAIPFAVIPGSTLLLPLIVSVGKKYNIDILPSAFSETIIYVNEYSFIANGDMIEFEGTRWIVEDISQDVKLIDREDRIDLDAFKAAKCIVPYLATKKIKDGDLVVPEDQIANPGIHPYIYDSKLHKNMDLVKILRQIDKADYIKII